MAFLERLRACYSLQVHITSKCVLLHLLLLKSRSLSDVVYLLAVVSTMGSCACFGLSRLIGKALAHALWPERLEVFKQEVSDAHPERRVAATWSRGLKHGCGVPRWRNARGICSATL